MNHSYHLLHAQALLTLAQLRLTTGRPTVALRLLRTALPPLLSWGSGDEQAQAYLLISQCLIAKVGELGQPEQNGGNLLQRDSERLLCLQDADRALWRARRCLQRRVTAGSQQQCFRGGNQRQQGAQANSKSSGEVAPLIGEVAYLHARVLHELGRGEERDVAATVWLHSMALLQNAS